MLAERIAESLGREDMARQVETASGQNFIWDFGQVLSEAASERTTIIVVDTFEEAQFLGSDVVYPLVWFLHELARSLPMVRLILSGRTLPDEFGWIVFTEPGPLGTQDAGDEDPLAAIPLPQRPIDLGVLDQQAARELLARSLEQATGQRLGVDELDDVIEVVSRNPMCLKLAARLLRDEGVEKLRSTRSEVLVQLKAEKVQALLYGRILNHVHADDVKKIAYPGLIVRRITPEVIRDVLAKPCKLELTAARDEYAIFGELQREAALVDVDREDNSLRHRTDVRRAMLEDLTDHVDSALVDEIDAAAIAFYERQEGPIARAEELYHRLRRHEPAAVLDQRWLPGAASRLKNVGDELPARQRLWLAEKLGVTLDASVRETAGQEAWEAQTARSVDRYLYSRKAEPALELLGEREQRLPRSELFAREAEALRFAGRYDEALAVARAGVESTSRAGAIDMALELLLKMVLIEEGRDDFDAALALVEEATAVAAHSSSAVLELQTAVTGLRVHRRRHPDRHEARAELRAQALAMVTPELLRDLRSRPVLLREVAAELGNHDARIASAAIETLGVEVASDEQAEILGAALSELGIAAETGSHLAEALEGSDGSPDVVRDWVSKNVSSKQSQEIGKTLSESEPGGSLLRKFRDYFRAGVDRSLRGPDGS